MLEITMFSFHSSPMVLISSSESPSVLAIISRKRPVPAAHLSKGAHYLNPNVRTVIDIGGQDIKAISIDENGAVKNRPLHGM